MKMQGNSSYLHFYYVLFSLLSVFAVAINVADTSFAAESIKASNEYITVSVNNSDDGAGRFSLSTTGGDPSSVFDDNRPLIYGGADPWTSFTTVQIDGSDYIFGGSTNRRAGKKRPVGQVVTAPRRIPDGITTTYEIQGIYATQLLTLVKSGTTGCANTLKIEYILQNRTDRPKNVGLRVVLDTMLGTNDGAPFRLPDRSLAGAVVISGSDIPRFWQTFDSLRDPMVKAQGTLRGEGATLPSKVYFADWGTIADTTWEISINPMMGFLRKGEDEPDTATALLWEASELLPGASRRYVTYYGLGNITVSNIAVPSGNLYLGVTSPMEVDLAKSETEPIQIVAYLQNATNAVAKDLKVRISLPEHFESLQPLLRTIGPMASGKESQSGWHIVPVSGVTGDFRYTVDVLSGNDVLNTITRVVSIKTPDLALKVFPGTGDPVTGIVRVIGIVSNVSRGRAHNVKLSISIPDEWVPAPYEELIREIGSLESGESVNITWTFYSSGGHTAPVTVTASSENALNVSKSLDITAGVN